MLELRDRIEAIIEERNTIIDWNDSLEYVSVEHLSSGDEYFFQGDDYNMLYNDFKNSTMYEDYYFDEYLYLVSQNW